MTQARNIDPYAAPLPPMTAQVEAVARAEWAKVKADPDYLITSGALRLVSGHEVDKDGNFKRKTGVGGLFTPLRLTWPQQMMQAFPKWCRENDLPVSSIILKGRRVGASSLIQARLFSSCIANSGVRNAIVANSDISAENLLRMSRTYYAQLSGFNRFINTPENSKGKLTFGSNISGFEVADSSIISSTASPDGLERLLGSGTLKLHLSEYAFYSDPEKVEQVLSATIMRIPGAELWRESASNGENNHYGVEFISTWNKQNSLNFWEDGFRLATDAASTALFFSFFCDPQNKEPLLKGVHPVEFIESFDDYEKDLFFNVIVPYYLKKGLTRSMAEEEAIGNMGFRRAKLAKHYPGGFVIPDTYPFTDPRRFKAEYPATPEEAFEGTGLRTVIPAEVIRWVKDTCKDPIFEGYLTEGGSKGFSLTESDGGDVRLWKMPWETSGNLSMSLDPNEGIEGEAGSTGDNLRRDFSYASVFDNETGEQVAELCSQADDTTVARKVYALLMFMACTQEKDKNYVVSERRLPFFTQEQAGPRIVNYILKDRGYPIERIFTDTSLRTTDLRAQRRLGWTNSSASKGEAVKAFQEYLINGFNTRNEPEAKGIKRRIIRSKRIAEQIGWFVVKPSPSGHNKYEALDKGNWTVQSKDDGVMSVVIDCWAQETRISNGDEMFTIDGETKKEEDLTLPNYPLTSREAIIYEQKLLKYNMLGMNVAARQDYLRETGGQIVL